MNNFQKKNKLFSLSTENTLPNKELQSVQVNVGQIVRSSIANSLEQLVENDLFIERQLYDNINYEKGPKHYTVESFNAAPDGTKFWNVSQDGIKIQSKLGNKLIDDVVLSTASDVYSTIQSLYSSLSAEHIAHDHAANSPISYINSRLMPLDCSDYSGILEQNDAIADIVKEVKFDDGTGKISAYVEHNEKLSKHDGTVDGVTYLYKKFLKHNLVEFYIYVPSTNTFYLNHVDSVPTDDMNAKELLRKNVNATLSRKVEDNCTRLSVMLDNDYFKLANIQNVEINGNSLPLGLYIDNENRSQNERFSSIIKQSMPCSIDYMEQDGIVILKFILFGTDAQAIRFRAQSIIRYKIHFDPNALQDEYTGEMEDFECVAAREKELPECKFIKNGYVFDKWVLATNEAIEFQNMGQITSPLAQDDGEVVTLKAIWKEFKFEDGATAIKVKTDANDINIATGDKVHKGEYIIVDYDYGNDIND